MAQDEVSVLLAELEKANAHTIASSKKKKRKTTSWVTEVCKTLRRARTATLLSAWEPTQHSTCEVVNACREGARQYGCPPEVRGRLILAAKLIEESNSRIAASGVVATLDECYYTILAHEPNCLQPDAFFKKEKGSFKFLDEFIAKEGIDYSHFDFDQEHNPLAQLYLARQYETAWLFGSSNDNQYPLVEAKDARGEKLRDPVATKPLAFWRNTVRTGAAYHYAFAVPTNQALDIILSLNTQVIDIGAGTGYWAYQLQRRSRGEHQILAYDSVPCGTGRTNAYHGNAPSWFQVQRLEASQVPIPGTGATILVVYPPPDPDEAFLAGLVHRFAQSTIDQNSTNRLVLVSEWRGGDTASPACRTALLAKLTLEAHHPTTIPNWGDTSASLTIWKLGATQFPCPLDKCTACETYNAPALFRCRLSCDFQVCSQECAHAAVETYKAAVAAK